MPGSLPPYPQRVEYWNAHARSTGVPAFEFSSSRHERQPPVRFRRPPDDRFPTAAGQSESLPKAADQFKASSRPGGGPRWPQDD